MRDMQVIATAVVSLVTAEGTALYVGWLAGHTAEIRAGWVEGCEWLADRRRDLCAGWEATAVACRAVALWLLCLVLRPHGQHRQAGAA